MLREIKKMFQLRSPLDLYLVFIAFALPWQAKYVIMKGISPFNLINGIIVIGLFLWYMSRSPKPKLPFLFPLYLYLLGSIIGMFNSDVHLYNAYTLMQDLYLYIWFAIMCIILDRDERISLLVVAWMAILVVVIGTEGFWLQGESRLEYTFRNPNRASAYFVFSFFLVLHPVVPWVLKAGLLVLVFNAIGGTGSAAGSLGVLLGLFVFGWSLAYVWSPKVLRPFLSASVAVVGLVVLLINPMANESLPSVLGEVAPAAAPRIERSAETRQVIWGKGLASFKEHPMGIGPASFAGQVDTGLGEDGMIELHSDFVSTLVERGVIGFLGYILIILWIAREVFRMLNLASMSPARRDGVWAAGLAGAVAAYFFYSITHEAMHHDSFWLLLALVFSQVRIMRSKFDAWASPREEIPPLSLDPARRNVDRRHLKARSPA